MSKTTNNFEELCFLNKVRVYNVSIFVLFKLFMSFNGLFALAYIFNFLHLLFSLIFVVFEITNIIKTKKIKYIFTNWVVLLGLIIFAFEVVIIILDKF